MGIGLGWAFVALVVHGQDVFQFRARHTNDADFLHGNDVGFTFRNRLEFHAFDEKDPAKRDLSVSAETEFFSETQPDPLHPGYVLGSPTGHPYLNYFERVRLSCSWRNWQEPHESFRTFTGHCVEVRHDTTDETDTGTRLQDTVHHQFLPDNSTEIYDYSQNRFDFNRTSVGVGAEVGLLWRPFEHLETESSVHCLMQSEGLKECTWGGETTLRFWPGADWNHERDRREALWNFYVRGDFEQDFDFKGCEMNFTYGIAAAIGLGGGKRLLLDFSCTKPLELDPSLDRGVGRDRDTLVEIGFGLSW